MPSEFHNREPLLPFGNPKSRPWYSMDIFWNRPLIKVRQNTDIERPTDCPTQTYSAKNNKVETKSKFILL